MINLFGQEQKYPEVGKDNRIHLGRIQKIKKRMGYRFSVGERKCKNCKSHQVSEYHDKTYHKCERIGYSHSEATDIRLKNVCDYWEKK